MWSGTSWREGPEPTKDSGLHLVAVKDSITVCLHMALGFLTIGS